MKPLAVLRPLAGLALGLSLATAHPNQKRQPPPAEKNLRVLADLAEALAAADEQADELRAELHASKAALERHTAENEKLAAELKAAWERSKRADEIAGDFAELTAERNRLNKKLRAVAAEYDATLAEERGRHQQQLEAKLAEARVLHKRQLAQSELLREQLAQRLADLQATPPEPEATPPAAPPADRSLVATLYFNKNAATSSPELQKALLKVRAILEREPKSLLSITGHTSNTGNPEANSLLSRRRAAAVRDALVKGGVPVGVLAVVGAGQSSPIADNATAEGRRMNRRVEIRLRERTQLPGSGG